MTDKKTTKTEKQAVKKQPTELEDEQLADVQAGRADTASPKLVRVGHPSHPHLDPAIFGLDPATFGLDPS